MALRFPPLGPGVLGPDERHPLLTEPGRRVLQSLVDGPGAPVWNHHCGDRLDAAGLAAVRGFAAEVATGAPPWIGPFVERVTRTVPRYREPGAGIEAPFTTSRDDLVRAWWTVVPDDASLDDLIWYPTSGVGQPPAVVPTHPVAVSCYYPLLLAAARWHGVTVTFRDDRADWMTVFSQGQGGFTVPSWSSVLGCGTAKVNLERPGWKADGARGRFLARHDPRVITGDPISLSRLADLDVDLHPAVLVSTALTLNPATRDRIAARFGCPVVDVYSTRETGPIAASRPQGGWGLLQPRLIVDVVDDGGWPCAPGVRGTVCVTGGMNPYLPLLRYVTGDTAVLDGGVLREFVGRAPVLLRSATGETVNSHDVTQVLEPLPLRRWAVVQRADGSVLVSVEAEGAAVDGAVVAAVQVALGPVAVTVERLTEPDKVIPFRVDAA